MTAIETSRHFTKTVDSVSGTAYWVLNTKVSPQQQAFYFVNPSMDREARYLWFYCSFPPAAYRTLGLVCLETDTVHHFPDTAFGNASPLCDEETGNVYFASAQGIYLRTPVPEEPLQKICDMPGEIRLGALPLSAATHLTFSADKQELFLDASAGNRKFTLGSIRLSDGRYTLWHTGDHLCNHAQFHPTDRDLVLFAEDYYTDPMTGRQVDIRVDKDGVYRRLWTMRRGETPHIWAPLGGFATHEWWSADGTALLYCNEAIGVIGIDIATGKQTVYDPVPAWHGHCSTRMEYFVADIAVENEYNVRHYRGCPTRVEFYNARTQKAVNIATRIPAMNPPAHPNPYHPDPHPRFNCGDRYILFTLNRTGLCEVAAAPVKPLIELTQ